MKERTMGRGVWTLALGFLCGLAVLRQAHAEEATQSGTAEQPRPAEVELEHTFLQPVKGVQFQINEVNEVLGNVSGGVRRTAVFEGLLKLGVQLDLEPLTGWKGGTFLANAYWSYGNSLTAKAVGDLNVLSNIDAPDSVRLNEVWFEQKFGERATLRLGLQAADVEFYVCDSASLFLNAGFGAPPIVTGNLANLPTFPLTSPAVRFEWDFSKDTLLRVAAFSGDVGTPNGNNRNGTRFAFSSGSGVALAAEFATKTSAQGTYKLGATYSTGRSLDFTGAEHGGHGAGAVYAIADQALYRPEKGKAGDGKGQPEAPDDIGLNGFAEVGFGIPGDHVLVSQYFEAGLTYKGPFANRREDIVGLICGYTGISREVASSTHHECVVEASYQYVVRKGVSLQPDLQVVANPGALERARTAVVLGLRCTLTF